MTDDLLGTLTRVDGRVTARFERLYETNPEELWAALTATDRLARWFAQVDGDLQEGGRFVIVFDPEDPSQQARGTVLECQPPRRLIVSWLIDDEPETWILVELEAADGVTLLTLEHSRLSPGAAAGYGAGWHAHLERLEAFLVKADANGPEWGTRWSELILDYRVLLLGDDRAGH